MKYLASYTVTVKSDLVLKPEEMERLYWLFNDHSSEELDTKLEVFLESRTFSGYCNTSLASFGRDEEFCEEIRDWCIDNLKGVTDEDCIKVRSFCDEINLVTYNSAWEDDCDDGSYMDVYFDDEHDGDPSFVKDEIDLWIETHLDVNEEDCRKFMKAAKKLYGSTAINFPLILADGSKDTQTIGEYITSCLTAYEYGK